MFVFSSLWRGDTTISDDIFFIPGHPLRHAARLLVGPHGTRDDCTAPENPNDLVLAFQLQLLMQSIPTEAPIIRLMQALLCF